MVMALLQVGCVSSWSCWRGWYSEDEWSEEKAVMVLMMAMVMVLQMTYECVFSPDTDGDDGMDAAESKAQSAAKMQDDEPSCSESFGRSFGAPGHADLTDEG